jgi:TetR/AcrR family transcriptional regulator
MKMAAAYTVGARAERTRKLLVQAAEHLFAERGFAATRLEDVAERVGIRRASILYYFRDKRALYDAVLVDIFADLGARLNTAISAKGSLREQIEAGVSTWVEYAGSRPSLARILLREIADAVPGREPAIIDYARPILTRFTEHISKGQKQGLILAIDPIHFVSTLAGATVFFIAATPLLGADWPFDPLSPEQLAAHRREVQRITERLLGTRGTRPSRPREKRPLAKEKVAK